ncbi:MAG: helix-turn-helix transcriptional regulator [Pseudomonadota bacterium]
MKEKNHLPNNLRLLVGYSRSISDVCRHIGISRQQFTKYLSGKTFPTFRSLQRICDHFGLEDWELLLPHSEFRNLVAIRPPESISRSRPYKSAIESELWARSQASKDLASFLGYYYNHFVVKGRISLIQRTLIHLFEVDGVVGTKTIERTHGEKNVAASVQKFDGIAYYSGHRLYITERERFLGHTIWNTTLYATTTHREQFFSGLSVGSTTDSVQDISCYRSIFQFLGRTVNRYNALKGCGWFPLDSPDVSAYVREHIENRIEEGDNAFVAA